MASDTKPDLAGKQNPRPLLILLICLLAVIGVLFHGSFQPELVIFNNDAPLGAANSQADEMWSDLKSVWMDLNWVGNASPAGAPTLSFMVLAVCGTIAHY